MYRAVALWAVRNGTSLDDAAHLEQLALNAQIGLEKGRTILNGEDVTDTIRTAEMSAAASKVAAVAGVRKAMVAKQRQLSTTASIVMEGRDIGTVVFPDARVKIFLDAPSSERTRRRLAEHGGQEEIVALQIAERDSRDTARAESPLMQAPDAIYLDSGGKTIEEVEEAILKLIRDRTANGKEIHR